MLESGIDLKPRHREYKQKDVFSKPPFGWYRERRYPARELDSEENCYEVKENIKLFFGDQPFQYYTPEELALTTEHRQDVVYADKSIFRGRQKVISWSELTNPCLQSLIRHIHWNYALFDAPNLSILDYQYAFRQIIYSGNDINCYCAEAGLSFIDKEYVLHEPHIDQSLLTVFINHHNYLGRIRLQVFVGNDWSDIPFDRSSFVILPGKQSKRFHPAQHRVIYRNKGPVDYRSAFVLQFRQKECKA